MIWHVFLVPVFFALCSASGILVTLYLSKVTKGGRSLIQYTVVGLATMVIVSGWLAYCNVRATFFYPLIFLTLLLIPKLFYLSSLIKSLSRGYKRKPLKRTVETLSGISVVSLILSSLINGDLFSERFSFRNGPDLFGWISSSKFFSNSDTIAQLSDRVISQANVSEVQDLFVLPHPPIYAIASVTDQVNAEFILGANRFALQYFLGSLNTLPIGEHIISWVTSFIVFLGILQVVLIKEILISLGVSQTKSLIFSVTVSLGLNVLSPLLEGGLGQYFSLTLFLALIHRFLMHERKVDIGSALIISGLAWAYFDSVIFLIVFVLTFLIVKTVATREIGWLNRQNAVYFFGYSFSISLVTLPIFLKIISLVQARVSGHRGGWNQGRFPLFTDAIGFYNWLPPDSLSSTNFSPLSLVVFAFFLYLNFSILRSKHVSINPKLILISFTLIYIYFLIDVYIINRVEINNYNLLKYGQYLALFNVMFLFCISEFSLKTRFRSMKKQLSNLSTFVCVFCLGFSSMSYQSDYFQNRSFTLDQKSNKEFSKLLETYDVFAYGFTGPGLVQLILFGDLRYGADNRGFGTPTQRSQPERPLLVVTPKNVCKDDACQFLDEGQRKPLIGFIELPNLSLYRIGLE